MVEIAFGTDGIRGPAGAFPIVPEVAVRVGAAVARLARESGGGRVLVAHDGRPSGSALVQAVLGGVLGAGARALDAGVVPTSAVQVAVEADLADAAVMVTASHNPAPDNGFKVLGPRGRKPDDARAAQLTGWMQQEAVAADRPGEDVAGAVATLWCDRLFAAVGDLSPLSGRRIVIDLANGALCAVKDRLAARLPPGVAFVGTGGTINEACGSEHLAHVSDRVRTISAHAGLAVDGDGDRCRIVDERGREVSGDAVIWRLATDLRASMIAVTIMSNGALEQRLPGVRVLRTPVGDRFLREVMDRDGLVLGGEESGHVLFADFAGGDGLLTGLRSLCCAFRASPDVSTAFAPFVPLPRRLTKVKARVRLPLDEVAGIERARIVGLERLGPHGRVFLRYSGTEPVVRILVEGEPFEAVEAVSASVTSTATRVLS